MKLQGRALLALRHVQHHRGRSVVLVACIALTVYVPLVATWLMARYEDSLGARARETPLLVGARGNRYDLVLGALYFRPAELQEVTWREYDDLVAAGRGVCIPLHVGCTAQGRPLVATTVEYAEHRGLGLAAGTDPLRIGEATLGAAPGKNSDDVDRFGDQRARNSDDGLLDQLLKTAQRAERRACVDCPDAAGVTGAPGFQEVEGFGPADLADRNAVGPKAQRRADEV